MLKQYLPGSVKRLGKSLLFPVPSRLSRQFIQIDETRLRSIETSIREHYHTGWRSEANYPPEKYRADLEAHLFARLEIDRREIIPWLDDATTLRNKRVLEIGCGTGSSTIALAEQGARVTGIDIDDGGLLVAEERARVYGVDAHFLRLNARDMADTFRATAFDIIIFFACLEHMTLAERLASIRDAWNMLPADGVLVVVETPNRLWYFDGHTSQLPFFHWLPDDLAFAYSRFSPRENFRELYRNYDAASSEHFLRRGRGVSFHEFDLAIGRTQDLNVISSLSTFEGIRYKLRKSKLDRRYKSVLARIYPRIHEGFLDETLYLIIGKMEKAGRRT